MVVCLTIPVLALDEYEVRLAQVQTDAYPEIALYVEVSDASGKPVVDLGQADFAITEDGELVDIAGFAGVGDERSVDVVFVFDTTGSMGDEVKGVKDTCIRFAQELEDKGRDYRLGLVTFWDEVKEVRGERGQLTDDAREFKRWIERIRIVPGAGDDVPENDFGALKEASRMRFRAGAQRVFILITDAPPHHYGDRPDGGASFDDPDLDPDRILDILAEQTVTVYAVAYDHPDFHRLAGETGGKFYDIAREPDFTGIIEEIGTAIATQYRIIYRSPRPTFDGTRRDIRVFMGSGTGSVSSDSGEYLEEHLLHIQSDPLVGLFFLLLLLILLAVPAGFWRVARRKAVPVSIAPDQPGFPESLLPPVLPPSYAPPPGQSEARPMQPAQPAMQPFSSCPHCGNPVRRGARFCAHCSRPISSAKMSPPPRPATSACPSCGRAVRPGTRFCPWCGIARSI